VAAGRDGIRGEAKTGGAKATLLGPTLGCGEKISEAGKTTLEGKQKMEKPECKEDPVFRAQGESVVT